MPARIWPHEYYPHFCAGFTVMLSPDLVQPIVQLANAATEQYLMDFWLDDVLYTGIFAQLIDGVTLRSDRGNFVNLGSSTKCDNKCVAFHTSATPENIRKLYYDYNNTTTYNR